MDNQKALPSPEHDKPIKQNRWELEEPDELDNLAEYDYSLETLLDWVNREIASGTEIKDILRRRLVHKVDPATGQSLMKDEEYSTYLLDFYASKTSQGYRPVIGIRHMRSDIWDALYLITRSPEVFSGRFTRLLSVVETCMIHIGLQGLDILLAKRPKVVEARKDAIWKGGKEKRRQSRLPAYKFVVLTEVEDKQKNIYCLSPEDYGRIAAIAEDYGWDMGFVVQMTMIIGMGKSEKLPEYLRIGAIEEVTYFYEYLKRYLFIV